MRLIRYAIIIVIGLCLVISNAYCRIVESGTIDTDVIANDLLNLINIPARSTTIAGFNVTFGENEISVEMPKNILTQLIGIGRVKINQDDINKFIEMIK